MKRAATWGTAVSLLVGLLYADEVKRDAVKQQGAAAPATKPGSLKSSSTSRSPSTSEPGASAAGTENPTGVEPLSLEYVPRDAIAAP